MVGDLLIILAGTDECDELARKLFFLLPPKPDVSPNI